MSLRRRHVLLPLAVLSIFAGLASLRAQAPDAEDRDRAHRMLKYVWRDLQEHYYDSTYGGLDMAARYKTADSTLDHSPTLQEMFGVIAQFLLDLKDSHTRFSPPRRAVAVEYGWTWTVIGNALYVDSVVSGSDAATKGLTRGDRVLAIDGILPTRESEGLIWYVYNLLNPRPGMRVVVQRTDGSQQELEVLAKITPSIRVIDYTSFADRGRMLEESRAALRALRHRTRSFGDTALVWRMRQFIGGDELSIDGIMDLARGHRTLILDLRDNPGGAVTTTRRLLGHFFDQETRAYTVVTRRKREPTLVTPVGRRPFSGNLIILINANSGSASEITSRVLQLEGKATVVGDRSAGAVMTSIFRQYEVGFNKLLPFGMSVTVTDIIMGDGNRLENVGVTPEFIVLPTGADLAAGRDPQMAKALQLAGIQLDPAEAAHIFQQRRRN